MAKSGSNWTPGWRRTPPGVHATFGDHLLAFALVANLEVRLLTNQSGVRSESDLDDDTVTEVGDSVEISLKNNRGRRFHINLSNMTVQELETLEEALALGMARAKEVASIRDAVAEEAARNGEDIYYRRHRATPRLSVFERTFAKHAQSLPGGSPDDVARDALGSASSSGPGENGGGVAEPDQALGSSEAGGS